MREEVSLEAVTIKEISGTAIETIPIGTKFVITWIDFNKKNLPYEHSMCSGLDISEIWNDEFVLI
jgi:hypothetical protein